MNELKKNIKNNLGRMLEAGEVTIGQEISRMEVISFDIFDTLVKRNVQSPITVHKLVRQEYLARMETDISDYQELRIAAEQKAREKSSKEDVSLDEIFACMEMEHFDKDELQKLEEEIEIGICCPNLRMKNIYEQALKKGKRVIITSDMYLPESVIKAILQKCGYTGFEKLYLSSVYGLCKGTGSIYDVIKKDYTDCNGKILHIGDNVKSDYFMPLKKGIKPCLIDGQKNELKYWRRKNPKIEDSLSYEWMYSFLNNHIKDDINAEARIGYEVLGPMLLGYCTWLNEKIKQDQIEKLFFLSREGKILQEAFNILYPENELPQTYLYVSRQALVVPLLADTQNFDEMIEILKPFLHAPILKTICTLCGLEQEKFNEALANIGLQEKTGIYEISEENKAKIYHFFYKMRGNELKQQKRYIEKYLNENAFAGNLAVIDIGWVGTMQMTLQKYVKESDAALHGYYFGVRNKESEEGYYDGFQRNGYLFEPDKNNEFDLMIRFTTEIFELPLLSTSGSVSNYSSRGNIIEPILSEPEYNGYTGELLEMMQSWAFYFLNAFKEDMLFKEGRLIPPDILMSAYAKFAVYPKMDTVKMLGGFPFFDEGDMRKILPEHELFFYMLHFQELKQDLNKCFCKIFFLKRLFKVDFPYFNLLKMLVNKLNIKNEFRKRYYNAKGNGKMLV